MAQWSCTQCTYLNDPQSSQCAICELQREFEDSVQLHSVQSDHALALQMQQMLNEESPQRALQQESKNQHEERPRRSNSSNSNSNSSRPAEQSDHEQSTSNSDVEADSSEHRSSASDNSKVNSAAPKRVVKISRKQRKRKREEISKDEVSEEDEQDSDKKRRRVSSEAKAVHSSFSGNRNNEREISIVPEVQWKWKEQSVIDHFDSKGIIHKIGQNWGPGASAWSNPGIAAARGEQPRITLTVSGADSVASGNNPITSLLNSNARDGLDDKGCVITEGDADDARPYIILDLHDVRVQIKRYVLECPHVFHHEGGTDCNVPNEWVILGTNEEAPTIMSHGWKVIHRHQMDAKQRARHASSSNRISNAWERCFEIKSDKKNKMPFYSKFMIMMTKPCWNAAEKNLTGRNTLILKYLDFYGNVKRKAYRVERQNEIKQLKDFPIMHPHGRCFGDVSLLLGIFDREYADELYGFGDQLDDIPDLAITLKDYQHHGVAWMMNQEETSLGGGWLCDEMGLGKTVQTIALMLAQRARLSQGQRERTLIITPLSLIGQWESELNKIAKPGAFKVLIYHGASLIKKLKRADLEAADVVLSTTSTFGNIIGKMTKEWDDFAGEYWTKGLNQKMIYKLEDGFFARMVVDEAHQIKNTDSKRSKVLCSFATNCAHRWCLTATPIHNAFPADIAGLARFVGIEHSDLTALKLSSSERETVSADPKCRGSSHRNEWQNGFIWLNLNSELCANKLSNFLKGVMIRRLKKNVLGDDFPEKREETLSISMSADEAVLYAKLAGDAAKQYAEWKSDPVIAVTSRSLHLLRMLTKLRKLCCHASLVLNAKSSDADSLCLGGAGDVLAKLAESVVGRINSMESLLDYECPICMEDTALTGAILSKCGHLFCAECLNEQLADKPECGLCRERFTKSNVLRITYVLKSAQLESRHKDEFAKFERARADADDAADAMAREMADDEILKRVMAEFKETTRRSAKVDAIVDRLRWIERKHVGDKAIVFSNFTDFLKVIGDQLANQETPIRSLSFDSSLNRKNRKKVLSQFETDSSVAVLLISARCASVGLNLMCANHVLFADERFPANPSLDAQAVARCWRLGQKKTVYVARFVTDGTIERHIADLLGAEAEAKSKQGRTKLKERDYDALFEYQQPDSPSEEGDEVAG